MKKMTIGWLLLLLLGQACRKENNNLPAEKEKTRMDLITQKPWILEGYGFDDNNNQQLDALENMIQDCQRDNTYEFFRDATGAVKENQQLCSNSVPVTSFSWQFKGDHELEVFYNVTKVLILSEATLALRHPLTGLHDSARFITVYKH